MPFAADATVCAALLRSGDRGLEPKAALKWAKRICKDMQPRDMVRICAAGAVRRGGTGLLGASLSWPWVNPTAWTSAQPEPRPKRPSINALSLISGIIAVSDTAVGAHPGLEGSVASVVGAKARLVFRAFDFMSRGTITEAEVGTAVGVVVT